MNELRTIRKEMGLTQVEAANICGVSRRTYQTYESSGDLLKLERIKELLISKHQRVLSISSIRATCRQVFSKYPEVKCAYLYGSYARKEARGDSDIDILVVSDPMGMTFYHMAGELKEILGKEVDLQTHRQIGDNQIFLEAILVDGIKIYSHR